jgi:hypothetical protein
MQWDLRMEDSSIPIWNQVIQDRYTRSERLLCVTAIVVKLSVGIYKACDLAENEHVTVKGPVEFSAFSTTFPRASTGWIPRVELIKHQTLPGVAFSG